MNQIAAHRNRSDCCVAHRHDTPGPDSWFGRGAKHSDRRNAHYPHARLPGHRRAQPHVAVSPIRRRPCFVVSGDALGSSRCLANPAGLARIARWNALRAKGIPPTSAEVQSRRTAKWARPVSNRRLLPCKGSALPTELRARGLATKPVSRGSHRDPCGVAGPERGKPRSRFGNKTLPFRCRTDMFHSETYPYR